MFLFRAPPFRRLGLVLVLVLAVHGLLVLVALHTSRKDTQAEPVISGFFLTEVGVASRSNSIRASDSMASKGIPSVPPSTTAPIVPTPAKSDIGPATPTATPAGSENVKDSQSGVGSYQREQDVSSETANSAKNSASPARMPPSVIIRGSMSYAGKDELQAAFRSSRAFRRGLSGTVVLLVSVDERGTPVSVTVKSSSGDSDLDKIAIDHVKRYVRLNPKTVDGVPVQDQVEIPFVMKIEDAY